MIRLATAPDAKAIAQIYAPIVAGTLYTSLFALVRMQGIHAVHAGITLPRARRRAGASAFSRRRAAEPRVEAGLAAGEALRSG